MSLQTHVTVLFAETFLRFSIFLWIVSAKSLPLCFFWKAMPSSFFVSVSISIHGCYHKKFVVLRKKTFLEEVALFPFFIRDWRGKKKISLSPPVCCHAIACWAFLDSFWHCSQNTDSSDNADCWLKLKLFFFLHTPSNFHKIQNWILFTACTFV